MHPYQKLGPKAFWSTSIAQRNMFDIEGLWEPKFPIRKHMKISTFGSCFAQHIGMALKQSGYNWFIAEPAPWGLSKEHAKQFNFGVFSARTGNIYTATLLKQWVNWALGKAAAPDEVWEKDSRFIDPFRPTIEPHGFASIDELQKSRQSAIEAFATTLRESRVFVFTLGLTESWQNIDGHYEYPMCPGTAAGIFDERKHKFLNQGYALIRKTLVETINLIRSINPKIRFLFTVSPVPLTATNSGRHVLVATMQSKSVLRAVAGSICDSIACADYFPSYEIINSTPYRGIFFEPNQRSVNSAGVTLVMKNFFSCLQAKFPEVLQGQNRQFSTTDQPRSHNSSLTSRANKSMGPTSSEVCDEVLLNAFATKGD